MTLHDLKPTDILSLHDTSNLIEVSHEDTLLAFIQLILAEVLTAGIHYVELPSVSEEDSLLPEVFLTQQGAVEIETYLSESL